MQNEVEATSEKATAILKAEKTALAAFIENDYSLYKDTIDGIEITNDDEMKLAGEFRSKLNDFCKKVEERRKQAVNPFNAIVKEINGQYKTATLLFDALLDRLEKKMLPYMQIVAKRKEEAAARYRAEELERIAEKQKELMAIAEATDSEDALELAVSVEATKIELESKDIVVHKNIKSDAVSTALIDNWKSRVVNAAIVPREYCVPDEKALNAYAKANAEALKAGTAKPVPGVEFYNEQRIGSHKRSGGIS